MDRGSQLSKDDEEEEKQEEEEKINIKFNNPHLAKKPAGQLSNALPCLAASLRNALTPQPSNPCLGTHRLLIPYPPVV